MTREEAIKIIESNCSCSGGKLQEACAMFIPELRESEDEKIRKSIIHILQVGGYMPDEEKKKAFAYLERQKYEYEIFEPIESTLEYKAGFRAGIESERQKEQKPVQDKEEREYVRTLKSLIADFLRDKEDVNRGYYQDIYNWLDGRHIEQKLSTAKDIAAAYQMGLAEGRKEQKPAASWTIQDARPGDILNSARVQATIIFKGFNHDGKHIDAYCALQKGFFIAQELPWDRDFEPATQFWKDALFDAMVRKGYLWDAENKRLNKAVQKPAEKQDYSGLTDLERAIHRGFLSAGVENVPVTIIKETANESLAQMKLAEWSEEDEFMRDTVLNTLERIGDYGTIGMQKDWLKSLHPRPIWKPSEEQMNALNSIILNGSFTYVGQVQDLISLKDELKKL